MSLFSVEAYYHPSCRKEHTRQAGVDRSDCTERQTIKFEIKQAHKCAFEKVHSLIEERIFNIANKEQRAEKLTSNFKSMNLDDG